VFDARALEGEKDAVDPEYETAPGIAVDACINVKVVDVIVV
jgi:hypothetical protein